MIDRHARALRRSKPEAAIPGLAELEKAVAGARTQAEMRDRVLEVYSKLGPEKLAKQLALARIAAEKEGIAAVEAKVHGEP